MVLPVSRLGTPLRRRVRHPLGHRSPVVRSCPGTLSRLMKDVLINVSVLQ